MVENADFFFTLKILYSPKKLLITAKEMIFITQSILKKIDIHLAPYCIHLFRVPVNNYKCMIID